MEERPDAAIALSVTRKRLKKAARILYGLMFLATLAVAFLGLFYGETGDLVLTVPIIVIMGLTIISDRRFVHIPPALIILMIATFYVTLAVRQLLEGDIVAVISGILMGVNLGLLGLIFVYMLLRSMPGVRNENTIMVAAVTMAVSLAIYMFMRMIQYWTAIQWDRIEPVYLDAFMLECLMVVIGSAIVCGLYFLDSRRRLFRYTLDSFLEENAVTLGIDDRDRKDILDTVSAGESDTLEFKSTLRTNLHTGEVDKRMEKAVLKTLVAFLNTDGGTLMIGVSDNGDVCGADLHSFENKDKMNLHLTNLIASQIGNGYLHYISFNMVDFDGKVVIRVRCDPSPRPVFLREGKQETFYVRSGASSVELTGSNLVSYTASRFEPNPLDRLTVGHIKRVVVEVEEKEDKKA